MAGCTWENIFKVPSKEEESQGIDEKPAKSNIEFRRRFGKDVLKFGRDRMKHGVPGKSGSRNVVERPRNERNIRGDHRKMEKWKRGQDAKKDASIGDGGIVDESHEGGIGGKHLNQKTDDKNKHGNGDGLSDGRNKGGEKEGEKGHGELESEKGQKKNKKIGEGEKAKLSGIAERNGHECRGQVEDHRGNKPSEPVDPRAQTHHLHGEFELEIFLKSKLVEKNDKGEHKSAKKEHAAIQARGVFEKRSVADDGKRLRSHFNFSAKPMVEDDRVDQNLKLGTHVRAARRPNIGRIGKSKVLKTSVIVHDFVAETGIARPLQRLIGRDVMLHVEH